MKKFLLGLLATVLFSVAGYAQEYKELTFDETTLTEISENDELIRQYVSDLKLPNEININYTGIRKYLSKNKLLTFLEIPIKSKKANLMFVIINNKNNESFHIFKKMGKDNYSFFDEDLNQIFSFGIGNDTPIFYVTEGCYGACRAAQFQIIENDFLADLGCSVNPCGAMVAVYCKGCCSGWWNCENM